MAVKSETKITNTGKIREALANALERLSRGDLAANDAKAMVGLANQITQNMAVELKHQSIQASLGLKVSTFGKINIGG